MGHFVYRSKQLEKIENYSTDLTLASLSPNKSPLINTTQKYDKSYRARLLLGTLSEK